MLRAEDYGGMLTKDLRLRGLVSSGRGEGAKFTELTWFREQVKRKLRFNPEPGTLNIKLLSEEDVALFKLLRSIEGLGVKIEPPEGYPYGGLSYRAELRRLGEEWWAHVYIILPLVDRYYEDVVELIAPAKLREALGLRDFDEVELSVKAFTDGGLSLEALLLDLEGTLVDNVGLNLQVVREALARHGVANVDLELIRVKLSQGMNLPLAIKAAVPYLGREEVSRVVEEARLLWRRRRARAEIIKGAKDLLEKAKERLAVAVITDLDLEPSEVYAWLRELGLEGLVDAVCTRRCVGFMKPSPLPVFYTCKLLGVDPRKCLLVGDSVADVKAGKLAGCLTCGLSTGVASIAELADEQPDFLVGDLSELHDVLRRLELL